MANLSWISSNPDYINQMIRNTQVTLSNNYNDLDNIPIIKITSTTNNPQKIWVLKEGLYMIDGVVQVDNNTSYEVSNLLISMTARLENGKYILSAFIPYLRGLFEYILKTNSTEYEQHQKIVLMIKNDTLTLDNETIYTPIENYHPATKKYVDDRANEIVTELDRMGINKKNLESLNKENRIRDIKLQALLSETSDRNITIEENVRYFDMPLSIDNGIVTINEIVGETLVNVCDQEESVAITKSYTIENENHIALQGEYDGSCRPVVYGNTLVNHNADWNDSLQTGIVTSANGTEDVQVEGIKGQEVSVVVEGNTVLNHALGKTSAVVSNVEDNLSLVSKFTFTLDNRIIRISPKLKIGIPYTLIFECTDYSLDGYTGVRFGNWSIDNGEDIDLIRTTGRKQYVFTVGQNSTYQYAELFIDAVHSSNTQAIIQNILLLEGDHITNPKYINSNEGNYVDLTVANDMSSVVEIEGRTMVNLVNHKSYEAQHLRAVSYNEVNKEYSMTIDNYTFPAFAIKLNYSTTLNKTYFISFKMKATATKNFKYNITHFDVYSAWNVGGEEYTLTENYQTFTKTFTSTVDEYLGLGFSFLRNDNNEFSDIVINIKDIMIFEGDLTQTPHLIPSGYVEGLKSSYECEATEDGKYKVDVKVTGKNLFDGVLPEKIDTWSSSCYIRKGTYRFSANLSGFNNGTRLVIAFMDKDDKVITNTRIGYNTILDRDCYKMYFYSNDYSYNQSVNNFVNISNFQIEEGTVATSYEPYFESTKTFYLNSPLLEGDKIVTKNGKVYHYHKMGKVIINPNSIIGEDTGVSKKARWLLWCHDSIKDVPQREIRSFCNNYPVVRGVDTWGTEGFKDGVSQNASQHKLYLYLEKYSTKSESNRELLKQELTQNPLEIIYELASPYYELIDEYNNTILNIPKNVAHLTHTSAVPVNNTTFTNYKDELNVLEVNTQYRVMFDCDKANVPFTVTLGGTSQTVTSKRGTHSLLITTPSTLADKNLVIDGIGRCGIDNIRIFKGDVEYDYVKGLWSGYEERKLENLTKIWSKLSWELNIYNTNGQCKLPNGGFSIDYSTDVTVARSIDDKELLKHGKVYTFVCKITKNTLERKIEMYPMIWYYGKILKGSCWIQPKELGTHVCCVQCNNDYSFKFAYQSANLVQNGILSFEGLMVLEGDWTDNPPTYEEVMANEGKYAVKVKLDTNATIFGKGGRL